MDFEATFAKPGKKTTSGLLVTSDIDSDQLGGLDNP
jgi:hypothetical protein